MSMTILAETNSIGSLDRLKDKNLETVIAIVEQPDEEDIDRQQIKGILSLCNEQAVLDQSCSSAFSKSSNKPLSKHKITAINSREMYIDSNHKTHRKQNNLIGSPLVSEEMY